MDKEILLTVVCIVTCEFKVMILSNIASRVAYICKQGDLKIKPHRVALRRKGEKKINPLGIEFSRT